MNQVAKNQSGDRIDNKLSYVLIQFLRTDFYDNII